MEFDDEYLAEAEAFKAEIDAQNEQMFQALEIYQNYTCNEIERSEYLTLIHYMYF